mmetsp:Transcript_5512/g.5241  ORF Transcript_5512/g.5241 Transcript_5512/m.5241 type:complete len:155 (+) Transcript_5512:105-569(+)
MLYEYFQYDDEWVEFYRHLGINLFLWNYRSFGRSTGSPSTKKIYEDAELIVEYLRNERGTTQKLGVHGQSLGGPVAAYLGRNCNMDFLFVDRSFSEIDRVVETSYGKFLKHCLKFFSLYSWKFESTMNYIYSNTYKVVSCDPNDEVIPSRASLK